MDCQLTSQSKLRNLVSSRWDTLMIKKLVVAFLAIMIHDTIHINFSGDNP